MQKLRAVLKECCNDVFHGKKEVFLKAMAGTIQPDSNRSMESEFDGYFSKADIEKAPSTKAADHSNLMQELASETVIPEASLSAVDIVHILSE